MKLTLSFLSLFLLSTSFYAQAFENSPRIELNPDMTECPYDPDTPVDIKVTIVEPDYDSSGTLDTSHSLSEIRTIAADMYSDTSGKVVAFADVKYSMAYEFSTRHFKLPGQDTECHWIEDIRFIFTFQKPPTILFPRELYEARTEDGGVCFDQIYAHEMQHIQDYETVFEEIVVKVEQDERFKPVASIPSRFQTLEIDVGSGASGRDSADKLLKQFVTSHYSGIIKRTMAEIKAEMQYLGNLLDSTHEYRRITELCRDMSGYIK